MTGAGAPSGTGPDEDDSPSEPLLLAEPIAALAPGLRVPPVDEHLNAGDTARFRERLGQALDELRELGQDKVRVTTLARVVSALADRPAVGCLRGRRIFLSAAMPDASESDAAHMLAPFVFTFARTMFSLGATLVFGGHPSIIPIVHRAIVDISAEDSGAIELHQLRMCIEAPPMEAKERRSFRDIRWHDVGKDVTDDRSALLAGMIGPDLDAAVFVGGRVVESKSQPPPAVAEYERFRNCPECPDRPVFLLGFADGAVSSLIERGEPPDHVVDPLIAHKLASTRDPALATALIVATLCRAPGSRTGG